MLADILKDRRFNIAFSFILGVGIVIILFKPLCKGSECIRLKAPSISELKDNVYNINDKCYTFTHKTEKCPIDSKDIIEPFILNTIDPILVQNEFARRQVDTFMSATKM
jgi:hypothetical protein